MILIDTNVLVAAATEDHIHHRPSAAFLLRLDRSTAVVAAHSFAELFSTLTRANAGFRMPGRTAAAAVAAFASELTTVVMTAPQTLDAIRRFGALGIGPRLYDYLIGATGEAYGARTIVTWNTRHFTPLFPQLTVITPDAYRPSPRS